MLVCFNVSRRVSAYFAFVIKCLEMMFSRPLICGLVLSCICFIVTGLSEELTVNQSPSNITVNEGDSPQITCCWNKIRFSVKVVWYVNETKFLGVNEQRQENQTQTCSTLHFTNILKNDTGHYVCEVIQDIPFLRYVKGNGTDLSVSVRQLEKTTTEVSPLPQTTQTTDENVPTVFNPPTVVQVPTRLPAASSSQVVIYIFRSLPFICLLMAFFYLNWDDKQSKPVEHAVESGEGPDENLEAGETQRNETKEIKQGEKVSEQEKGRDNSEKPEVTAATEEEKETVVVVEQGSSPVHDNKNKTVSVLDTEEKTNLMADVEDVTVSVLGGIVSAL